MDYSSSSIWAWRIKDDIIWQCMRVLCAKLFQLCPTICNHMECSLPGSSIHGILQARILEWDAISFSRGYSSPRDLSCICCILALQANSSPLWLPGKPCGFSSSSAFNHCTTWEAVISLNYQIFWSCSSLSIYQNFLQEDKFTYESACYINCCLRRQLDPQTRPQREGECEGSWGVKVLGGNGCLDLPEKWRVRKRINPGGK